MDETKISTGGTTTGSGVDVQAKAARAAQHYRQNPPTPSGGAPTAAIVLDANDDAASATAKAMAANTSNEGDADVVAQIGTSWAALRGRLDAIGNDGNLSPEGKATRQRETFGDVVELVGALRNDAAEAEARADSLEQRVEDELIEFDDVEGEEKRALYDALMKLPGETVGKIFVALAERLGDLKDFEGARLVGILKLARAGALPNLPNYHLQAGWRALLAKSPHAPMVQAARGRADLLNRMAGSVQAAATKKAEASGLADDLRDQLGLSAFQPGRLGRPEGVEARILDIPASPADEARWGKAGRR